MVVDRSVLLLYTIVIVSVLVNIFEIPVTLRHRRQQIQKLCNDDNCDCSYHNISGTPGPYVAPGPSTTQPLVPMSILSKNVHFDSYNGVRYLDHTSLSRFYQCRPSDKNYIDDNITWCSQRTFRGPESPLVALVSFHGSGNTWLRYLLEQATGVYTGSIYCDNVLKAVFPGESIASGNVVVIKTHHADTRTLPKDIQLSTGREMYHKAIVLVRDPYDALVSEANRRWNSNRSRNSHVGIADETSFISNSKWDGLVDYKGIVWSFLLHTWLSQNDTPVHVVQYEKLISHTEIELEKILDFVNMPTSKEKMECVMKNSQGRFKRSSHLNFSPYSKENREALNRHMSQALALLAKHNIMYKPR